MSRFNNFQADYFDGQTAAHKSVSIFFSADGVTVHLTDPSNLWAWNDIELHFESINFARIRHKSTDAVLEVTSLEAIKALHAIKDHGIRTGAKGFTINLRSGIFVLFILMVGLVALGFALANPISQWLALRVPLGVESKIAEKIDIAATLGESCTDQTAYAGLKIITRRLMGDTSARQAPQITIIKTPIENAFTLPGNQIVLTTSLLQRAESPAEIAGVLAHELGHAQHRHVLASILRATLLTSVWSIAMGDFSSLMVIDPSTAVSIATLSFNRNQERQADAFALKLLLDRNIDPKPLAKMLESHGDSPLKFLSSHPGGNDRARTMMTAAAQNPWATDQQMGLTQKSWTALKNACR